VAVPFVFSQDLSDTLGEVFRPDVCANARTHGAYNVPVRRIDQDTFNEGPDLAHTGFDRVDGADFIPKDTVARLRGFD